MVPLSADRHGGGWYSYFAGALVHRGRILAAFWSSHGLARYNSLRGAYNPRPWRHHRYFRNRPGEVALDYRGLRFDSPNGKSYRNPERDEGPHAFSACTAHDDHADHGKMVRGCWASPDPGHFCRNWHLVRPALVKALVAKLDFLFRQLKLMPVLQLFKLTEQLLAGFIQEEIVRALRTDQGLNHGDFFLGNFLVLP